jgi:methylated-DNA-protein-cysteine methyltransferase-like protein
MIGGFCHLYIFLIARCCSHAILLIVYFCKYSCLFHIIIIVHARFIMPQPKDPNFFDNVYEVVRLIPQGRATSYAAVARYLGVARSARMVGWAMNNAHTQNPPVPAHRVVNRNGLLTGKYHFGEPDMMEKLLNDEGIKVKNDQIVDFQKLFWDPAVELAL